MTVAAGAREVASPKARRACWSGIARACALVAIAGAGLAWLGRVHVTTPATLAGCLARPRQGYATPALKGRLRRCAPLVAYGQPDPASGLVLARGPDPRPGRN